MKRTKKELIQKLMELVNRWEDKSEAERNERYNDCSSINDITTELDLIIEEYE